MLTLPACTLVTTGRTGTDFLQSLLDSHPEVLTFNGWLYFHTFWENSVCVSSGKFEVSDLIDEFIGKNFEKLKSRYDLVERKHQLGDNFDQSLDIDLEEFKSHALKFLEKRDIDSKSTLLAIYGAYALCLGQDLAKKTLFFHHVHHFEILPSYLKDFPDSRIICMTRDPRANFVSGIEHHRSNNHLYGVGDTDHASHLFAYIDRILKDATPLEFFEVEYIVIRIEDLGKHEILEALCSWLGISYNDVLTKSTWGGLRWHGDTLTIKKDNEVGWSKSVLENRWEKSLSATDKFVLNYIMSPRLKHYGYKHNTPGIFGAIVTPFLIMVPLSYELRYISLKYIQRSLKNREYEKLVRNGLSYVRRVMLFFKFYLKVTRRGKYYQPFLRTGLTELTPSGSAHQNKEPAA